MRGLAVTEDRLAQDVDDQPGSAGAPLRYMTAERRVLGGQDNAPGLGEDPPPGEGNNEACQTGRQPPSGSEQEPIHQPQRSWRRVAEDDVVEQPCSPLRSGDPQHLVGEPVDQVAPRRVRHQPPEPSLAPTFGPGGVGRGLAQQLVGERHGALDAGVVVVRRAIGGQVCLHGPYRPTKPLGLV